MIKQINVDSDYAYMDWITFYATPVSFIAEMSRINRISSRDIFSTLAIF